MHVNKYTFETCTMKILYSILQLTQQHSYKSFFQLLYDLLSKSLCVNFSFLCITNATESKILPFFCENNVILQINLLALELAPYLKCKAIKNFAIMCYFQADYCAQVTRCLPSTHAFFKCVSSAKRLDNDSLKFGATGQPHPQDLCKNALMEQPHIRHYDFNNAVLIIDN